MTFAQLPQKASIFVDANTFVYHFSQHPGLAAACTDLLDRIARQEVVGFTAADVVSDVAHRLMVMEASTLPRWPATGITKYLRNKPAEISKLTRFRQAVQEIPQFAIQVLPITFSLVESATTLSQQLGLLSGDALIVAVMQQHSLTNIASHDADFDRVPGITRYAPG